MFVYYKGSASKNVWGVKCEYRNVSEEEANELIATGEYFADPRDIGKPKETPKQEEAQESSKDKKEVKQKRGSRKNAKKSDS